MNRLGQELQELVQYHRRFYQIECEESIALPRAIRASRPRPTSPLLLRLFLGRKTIVHPLSFNRVSVDLCPR
jgi:hypothetical protein